jgi:hypothetical protein
LISIGIHFGYRPGEFRNVPVTSYLTLQFNAYGSALLETKELSSLKKATYIGATYLQPLGILQSLFRFTRTFKGFSGDKPLKNPRGSRVLDTYYTCN